MMRVCFVLASLFVSNIAGHGMMLDPPNRSSLWRFNFSAPINYQDNQNWCGGFWTQHGLNGGKCGVCGDVYSSPHPQDNENTGKYGSGIVTGVYKAGSVIEVLIHMTANHLGEFVYSLCELEDPNAPESGEECFQNLHFEDGSEKYYVKETDEFIMNRIQLPDVPCERCVLRWKWRCGNNWGQCDDSIWRAGCGNQEYFVSCSDITIV